MSTETVNDFGPAFNGFLYTATWQALQNVWVTKKPSDSVLTTRVVGEFSAGKSRLLRELLQPCTPSHLLPISSREVQTCLLLEVTYNPEPELSLIEKTSDTDIGSNSQRTLRTLDNFPERDAIADLDPLHYRLRLGVPLPELHLPNGDRYQEGDQPKRMFLIDTPGWNSGMDDMAERPADELLTGFMNLALVYVCSAMRVDHAYSRNRLKDFLRACTEADFLGNVRLQVIITHCPQAEVQRTQDRMRQAIQNLWHELGEKSDTLEMQVLGIDFEEDSPDQPKLQRLDKFRRLFWDFLLIPLQQPMQTASCTPRIPAYDFAAAMRQCQELLEHAHQSVIQARPARGFACGLTATHFMGLSASEARERMHLRWQSESGTSLVTLKAVCQPDLPSPPIDHPLHEWWQQHALSQVRSDLAQVAEFVQYLETALTQFEPALSGNLSVWFEEQLQPLHNATCRALNPEYNHTIQWFTYAQSYLGENTLLPNTTAMQRLECLMALSLIQARYVDAYSGINLATADRGRTIYSNTQTTNTDNMNKPRLFSSAEQQAVIFHYIDLLAQRTHTLEERLQRGEVELLQFELQSLQAEKVRTQALCADDVVHMLPVIFQQFWSKVDPPALYYMMGLQIAPKINAPYEEPGETVRKEILKRVRELSTAQRLQLSNTCHMLQNTYGLVYREGFQKLLTAPLA